LVSAIRGRFSENPPKGFETKADREKRQADEAAKRRSEREAIRRKRAEKAREAELERRIAERWEALTPGEQAILEAEALAACDEETRRSYEATTLAPSKRLLLTGIRTSYLRKLIEAEA